MFKALGQSQYKPLLLLLFMGIIGAVTAGIGKTALVVGLFIFIYGFYKTVIKRNKNGEAHLYAAIIMGAEVYFRMSFSGLPWEFGKISVVILLITGILSEREKRIIHPIFLIYIFLLLPAIVVPDWTSLEHFKKEIMFNFFGHISLIVAFFYFYKRKISLDEFVKIGRWIVYGVFMMSVLVFIKSPDYSAINYGGGSNFEASGGFGPNQVSSILGLGMFIMAYFLILNKRVFSYKFIDIFLLILFTLQGLFTLSRGGLFSAGIALFLGILLLYIFNFKQASKILKINLFRLALMGIILIFAYVQANNITDGAVAKRYLNVDEYGKQIKEDYSTHRIGIFEADIATFQENWITGVGIGGSREGRMEETGISAVHVEFSRILAEHGILGVIALLVLFLFPVGVYFRLKDAQSRLVLTAFVALSLLTMSHNAMRLVLPAFIYGLGFILIYNMQKNKAPK